jgi:glucose-1-phosphate thymidylyltransferase
VLIAQEFLGDDDFVMYLGDNFIIGGITELVEEFRAGTYDAQILLTKVDNPSQFGVAELGPTAASPRWWRSRRSRAATSRWSASTCSGPGIHDAVRAIKPSARGELEITDALQWLIDEGRDVRPHLVTGYWKDTGRLEDMLECNRKVLESVEPSSPAPSTPTARSSAGSSSEEGAVIERSVVRGRRSSAATPCCATPTSGPFTSIYFGCLLEDTEIEHSIVLEESTIRGVGRIEDSLIGKEVEVSPSTRLPKAHRLMLGDHSRVSIA